MTTQQLTPLLLCLALLLGPPRASAAQREVDPLALAALLVADGHWGRAEQALSELSPSDEGLDLARYHTLTGLVLLHAERYPEAARALGAAIEAGQTDPSVYLHLAQAQLGAGAHAAALAALDAGGPPLEAQPEAWALRARAQHGLGDVAAAASTLDAGVGRFPGDASLLRLKLYLLIELGLYQEAGEIGDRYLALAGQQVEPWLALAEALRQAGGLERAMLTLEEARLRWPGQPEVLSMLARVYLDAGAPLTAASLLSEAAVVEPARALEAAECYRRGGDLSRALYMNAQVAEGPQKARQRLGLLIEAGSFDRAAALGPRLERLELLGDDRLRYALAYAQFRAGEAQACLATLGPITDAAVFPMALELRQAVEACESAEGCL